MKHTHVARTRSEKSVIDPVCGMAVEADAPHHTTYRGRDFHFCSSGCQRKFSVAPERYMHPPERGRGMDDGMAPLKRPEAKKKGTDSMHRHVSRRGKRWADYLPLFILVGVAALAGAAIESGDPYGWAVEGWMHRFMGLFLTLFAMFKLFDPSGFADGFQMYDLLAKPFRPYAYVYPFIELALGLGYLAEWNLPVVYGATVVVMLFGAAGVGNALRRGLDINCACMGTVLKVPLSTVALTEDLGMAAMAAVMWAIR